MERPSAVRSGLFGGLVVSSVIVCFLLRAHVESPAAAQTPNAGPRGVPVLAYHYLRETNTMERIVRSIGAVLLNLPLISSSDYWTISSATFEKHLRCLRDKGFRTIPPETLIAYMKGEMVLEGRCVVITFDDGEESVYRIAYPLLKRYEMQAVVFVVTAHVGESWNGLELSPWSSLREMKESGAMEIGSHTHDLHYKTQKAGMSDLSAMVLEETTEEGEQRSVFEDLSRARREIERHTGDTTICLAWPFGFGSSSAETLAGAAGYVGIMTLRPGFNLPGDTPTHIKRYTITARTSFRSFEAIVSGRL